MVERARLTDAIALAAQPREGEYAIHDETLRGFMLRVQPGGSRSWVLRFRRGGKPRRVTLGQVGTMVADQARAAALALLAREKGGGRSPPSARFRPDAGAVRDGVCRAALALMEAVHAHNDHELPAPVHPTGPRRASRGCGHARRCRALVLRVWPRAARRRQQGARYPAGHVRPRHHLGPSSRERRQPLCGDHTLSPSAARPVVGGGRSGAARGGAAALRIRVSG